MAVLGDDDDYCIIDKEDYEYGNDDYDKLKQQPKQVIHQFYFAKFNPNFIDPALGERIERLELLKERLNEEKKMLLYQIDFLEQKKAREVSQPVNWNERHRDQTVWSFRRTLAKYWPESVDEDPEEAIHPELEDAKIDETIEKLTYQLGHGNHKIGDQMRLLREIKHMQGKKEDLKHQVKAAEVQTPPRGKWDHWQTLSKYKIQHSLADYLKERRETKECKEAPMKNEIRKAEERLCFINQKQARVHNRLLIAQNKLDEQAAIYDEYITLMQKAGELATKKDLIALEELSYKQVEEFMQRWKCFAEFTATYNRSGRYANAILASTIEE